MDWQTGRSQVALFAAMLTRFLGPSPDHGDRELDLLGLGQDLEALASTPLRITVIESWICWDFAFAAALQWGPASPDHGDRELDLLGHRLHVPVRRLPPEPDHGDRELDLLGHGARVGHQDQPRAGSR